MLILIGLLCTSMSFCPVPSWPSLKDLGFRGSEFRVRHLHALLPCPQLILPGKYSIVKTIQKTHRLICLVGWLVGWLVD